MKSEEEREKAKRKYEKKALPIHVALQNKLREMFNQMAKGDFNYPEEERYRKMIIGPGVMFGLPKDLRDRLDAE